MFFYCCVSVKWIECYSTLIHILHISLSILLGCPCCSTDATPENVARGMASRLKREKSHWAAGRLGDINFVGSTKTRGKVKLDNNYWRSHNILCRAEETFPAKHWHQLVFLHPVCKGTQQHRPSADLPNADGGLGPSSPTLGGGTGGRRRAGSDEALAQGHSEKRTCEGCTEHRS